MAFMKPYRIFPNKSPSKGRSNNRLRIEELLFAPIGTKIYFTAAETYGHNVQNVCHWLGGGGWFTSMKSQFDGVWITKLAEPDLSYRTGKKANA